MNFETMMAALDGAVEDHLCDDAVLIPAEGSPARLVRVMISHPADLDRLQVMTISRTRPTLSIAFSTAPDLIEGDMVEAANAVRWRIASAPTRSGDGRWWQAEIEPAE